MKSAMSGTLKATTPCSGAKIRLLEMSLARAGPKLLTPRPSRAAEMPATLARKSIRQCDV